MALKYELVLDLGEFNEKRKLPGYIFEEMKKHKMCKPVVTIKSGKSRVTMTADYYLIQAFVKDVLRPIVESWKQHTLGYSDFDEVAGISKINQIWDICNEDWSFEMRKRWDEMQVVIQDVFSNMPAYDKVYAFLFALIYTNTKDGNELHACQIKKLIEMSEYIFENYLTVKYVDVFEKFEKGSELKFPTTISW